MFEPSPNDPTLEEASKLLAQAEAEEAKDAGQQQPEATPQSDSATAEHRAAPGTEGQVDSTISKVGDTPATAEPQKTTETADDKTTADKGSKYQQNQVRLEGGWKKLNESKTELQKQQDAFKAQQDEFTKRQREFEAQQQKASQPKYKPEDYEQAAKNWQTEAEALEADGKFDEADAKRVLARKAVEHAKQLRDNPPPAPKTDVQAEAEFKAQQKEWWGKAAIDFPNVVKPGSPEQAALAALIKAEPAVINDPKGMYYAARLVTAEAAAASVPTITKENGELRAKVKELTEKLSIPGAGIATTVSRPKPDSEKTDDELEEELRAEAANQSR